MGKGYAAEWRAALLDGKRWITVDALLVGGTTAALLSGIEGDEGCCWMVLPLRFWVEEVDEGCAVCRQRAELLSGREEDDGCAAGWYDGCAAGWDDGVALLIERARWDTVISGRGLHC